MACLASAFRSSCGSWSDRPEVSAITLKIMPVNAKGGVYSCETEQPYGYVFRHRWRAGIVDVGLPGLAELGAQSRSRATLVPGKFELAERRLGFGTRRIAHTRQPLHFAAGSGRARFVRPDWIPCSSGK